MKGKLLGEAIRERRKVLGLTQDELAKKVGGISRPGVQKWESGTIPDSSKWNDIEKALQVSSGWLVSMMYENATVHVATGGAVAGGSAIVEFHRTPIPEASNVSPAPRSRLPPRDIPVISWVQAGEWQAVSDPYQPGYADEWVETSATKSPNAFALVVSGDSMEPEFRDGDIITVDPDRQPVSGSYVVVKNGHEATFKQFVRDGASVFLKPLNDRYPIRDMTGIDFRVVGVVVEKRKRY